ncbi:hypothetical protein HK100_010058 [Physocladia obscura]|uniref:Uncharacterized protein n=1 Tax=Physocladia obscura TaxID=109957 RepID=A0AAD5T3X8_9FUNG|nr:hypothetical protein HK100_010058 [Physocladia obscura]
MLVILIILSIFAFLNVISLGILLWVPAFWIFELFAIIGFVVDVGGVYAVWKVHPEFLVVFGWAQVVIVVINVIQFIALIATFGGFGVFGIFSVIVSIIFAVIVISTLYPLRRYGLALRAAATVDLVDVVVVKQQENIVEPTALNAEVIVQQQSEVIVQQSEVVLQQFDFAKTPEFAVPVVAVEAPAVEKGAKSSTSPL